MLYVIFQFLRTIFFNRMTERTARHIHQKVLNRVLRAPMSFFDVTPTGEILGWFAKDMFLMDITLHTTTELTFVVAFPGR